jgi:hypothetical protein
LLTFSSSLISPLFCTIQSWFILLLLLRFILLLLLRFILLLLLRFILLLLLRFILLLLLRFILLLLLSLIISISALFYSFRQDCRFDIIYRISFTFVQIVLLNLLLPSKEILHFIIIDFALFHLYLIIRFMILMGILIKNNNYVPESSHKSYQATPHMQLLFICLGQILCPHKTPEIVKKCTFYNWLAKINSYIFSFRHFYSTYSIYFIRDNL